MQRLLSSQKKKSSHSAVMVRERKGICSNPDSRTLLLLLEPDALHSSRLEMWGKYFNNKLGNRWGCAIISEPKKVKCFLKKKKNGLLQFEKCPTNVEPNRAMLQSTNYIE